MAALGDEEPKVRLRAAVLLCRRGDPRGLEWLEQAARADDSLLREKAIEAIGRSGGPAAVRALLGRICAGGFDGPNEAVAALVAMGEPAAGPMVAALPAMDHNARWATLSGLARLGAPAMAALCAALPGADGKLKSIVCEVLGGMDDRERVPHVPAEPLVLLLEDADARVRHVAAHGLGLLKWEPRDERERAAARAKG